MRDIDTGWRPTPAQQAEIDSYKYMPAKTECVILIYCVAHHGNGPSINEVSDLLGVGRSRARDLIDDLIADGRAVREDGKLSLTNAEYHHPLMRRVQTCAVNRALDGAA